MFSFKTARETLFVVKSIPGNFFLVSLTMSVELVDLERLILDSAETFLDSAQKKEADLKNPIINWDRMHVFYGKFYPIFVSFVFIFFISLSFFFSLRFSSLFCPFLTILL